MAQPTFELPDFLKGSTAAEIHERMMDALPDDIDDMPGGFPYDLTMPAALELEEMVNYYLVLALMAAFPQYAWGEWLDLHGQQAGLERHAAVAATGSVMVAGIAGTGIPEGTVFCTPGTSEAVSVSFSSTEDAVVGEDGYATVPVSADEAGSASNVPRGSIVVMAEPIAGIVAVYNEEATTGGADEEEDGDYYDRIAAEYDASMTYLGNDTDYVRWAKEAGAGGCIVIPAWDGPGTVKLALVGPDGGPAGEDLVQAVYDYIVSPGDRSARLLPTACAALTCVPVETLEVGYTLTGLVHDGTTDIAQIKADFSEAVKGVYDQAKADGVLRYNDVRPLIKGIAGVEDFGAFLMDGGTANIPLGTGVYPKTGSLDFG